MRSHFWRMALGFCLKSAALLGIVALPLHAWAVPCTGGLLDGLDPESLAKTLASPQGLAGALHGRVPGSSGALGPSQGGAAVLTVRDPENFFESRQVSLVAANPDVQETLQLFQRNDAICVRGELAPFGGDQVHILVSEAFVLQAMPDRYPELPPYRYTGPEPEQLPDAGVVQARIHSSVTGLLVVELGDRLVPVYLPEGMTCGDRYWRFDTVVLPFRKRLVPGPGGVTHLELDANACELQVIESLRQQNGHRVAVTGSLTLFPRSPLITRDTYAVSVAKDGFQTAYTVVNFDNREIFEAAQGLLAQAWQNATQGIERGRNHFVNPSVRVQVTGTLNMVSQDQANPQIVLEDIGGIVLM